MEPPALRRLLGQLADTQDEEISCAECLDLVSQYADLELAGAAGEASLPQLQQHLRQCGVCREEYEVLRDLLRLEDAARRGAT